MAVYRILDTSTGDVVLPVATNAGAPTSGTSGTLVGVAQPGSVLIDTTNKTLYQNTNTAASPTWTGLLSVISGLGFGTPAAITAGTTQTLAGATALKPLSIVNAANGNDGAALPTASGSGSVYFVITVGSAATPKIWPQATDKIDGGTTGAAVTLTAAHRAAVFVDTSANNWQSFLLGAVAS